MMINDSFIEFSKEDRERLSSFFADNAEFINNTNFIEYENIKLFGDLYESFIDENNLRENDIMMLFLAEIRYDQLAYKIIKDTRHIKTLQFSLPKNKLNSTIKKWYQESKISQYVPKQIINKSLEERIKQNQYERRVAYEEARKILVK